MRLKVRLLGFLFVRLRLAAYKLYLDFAVDPNAHRKFSPNG